MQHLARRPSALSPLSMTLHNCAWGPRSHEGDGRRFSGNDEPSMAELLGDPMMSRMLASDGVAKEDLATLVARVREQLRP
ncbi:MAG: hypothetical protein HZA67_04915 [Rhodospirillales bacterium]|jgi:hypothetical protein|nr:hypothetical protein [Rhodospirillales bacterium]MDK9721207.1 hypothetical protein [Rhodospirillales bacterium]